MSRDDVPTWTSNVPGSATQAYLSGLNRLRKNSFRWGIRALARM